MRLLLDTHALVFLASQQELLPRTVTQTIRASADSLYISTATAWEIAMLAKRGRLELPCEAAAFIDEALEHHGISEISIDRKISVHSVSLPDLHGDPFDRIIIATAVAHQLTIITKDRTIPTYPGVSTLWNKKKVG